MAAPWHAWRGPLGLLAIFVLAGCGATPKQTQSPLVFVKNRNLYVHNPRTETTRQLTSRRDATGDVALSPDARRVAYTAADHNGGTDIRVVPIAGGSERLVTPWESFAGVHTHIDPGWLDANRLVYMDDEHAASAAIGTAHAIEVNTLRRLPNTFLPPPLRGLVQEPLAVDSGIFAWSTREFRPGGSACESTSDLWIASGKRIHRLTRTPQVWESPLDPEPALPLLGSAGRFVSGAHSWGCTSDPKAKVEYELRSWSQRSSTVLVRFRARSADSDAHDPDAAWSPDRKQIAVVDPAGVLSVRSKRGALTVLSRGVSAVDW